MQLVVSHCGRQKRNGKIQDLYRAFACVLWVLTLTAKSFQCPLSTSARPISSPSLCSPRTVLPPLSNFPRGGHGVRFIVTCPGTAESVHHCCPHHKL